ncbi:hypothetical protein BVRB_5g110010 [Beta vulgaris subsp. vulgaris]|uniref:annexin D8 n=1 Tax=Beta vulgaris subsp. vulgaris TaxID=3555 RepID=UPI00053F9E09|nr:annexin D8 [Beta vulgaris subsp. vulgaris]KMT11320.1 hypothetical protein BVRB_5g110010 [Beta vulgaris subsp. vulgaris]
MATKFYPHNSITKSQSSCCESDCKAIHESWGRLSTLVWTLAKRTTQAERRQIRETYKTMFGEDILSHLQRLKLRLSGNSEESKFSVKACEALFLWMADSWERDACFANDALEGNETDYKALLEIFVGRKSSHVLMIKQVYQTRFKRLIDQDIVSLEPPHPCQRILVALSTSHKAHHADVSQDIAKCDAMRLYLTGEGSSGFINEAVVLEILSKRSIPQLKLTLSSYKRIYGHSYTKQLKKLNSTQFEDALRNLIECIQNPPKYYAKMLQRSINGEEEKKGSLARLMVSRAEIDMSEIQKIFRKKYGLELRDAICQAIPAGDYRDFMLILADKC